MVLDSPLQVLEFEVRVDFRAVEITVAQQLLHVPHAGAAAEKMRRAVMTLSVLGGFQFSLQRVVADAVGDHLIRQATAGY